MKAKWAKELADMMPVQYEYIIEPCEISGIDIHLSGLDDEGIDNTDRIYYIDMPFYYMVNHKRRIINAYKRHGIEGVKNYISKL